jgi:hypothetical protein
MAYSIRFVALIVLVLVVWLLSVILYTHHALDSHPISNPSNSKNVVSPHAVVGDKEEALLDALWPEDGQDKILFMSLNSCVEGCGSEPPGRPLKVGLLVPPGNMSQIFLNFCSTVAHHYSHGKNDNNDKNDNNNIRNDIQWIPTHHLPPSNDEYTHIVRFANIPLLLAVGDALRTVASPHDIITWQDVQETTKLLISWHCQLSNLADEETLPILTMSMEELEQDLYQQESTLTIFLFEDGSDEGGSGDHMNEEEMEKSLDDTIVGIKNLLRTVNKQLLKETKQGLVSLTKKTIKEILPGLQGCPKEGDLWQPTRQMAQRVYQFLKKGTPKDDSTICRNGDVSGTLACTLLAAGLETT